MSPGPIIQPSASEGDSDTDVHKLTVDNLEQKHRDVFTRALSHILSTPTAELTYAQIIDGAPLGPVVENSDAGALFPQNHPVLDQHLELCPGVLDTTRHSCSTFDLKVLKFDSQLLHSYHAASLGSRAFKTRLIEMVAISIHQIAVYLYNLDLDLGGHKDLVAWVAPTNDLLYMIYPDGKLPSLFFHSQYRDIDQYPNGAADMVGYWAENQIFGGVVLFDRRKPSEREPHEDPDAIYIHPSHKKVTYRICKLLDTQKNKLLDYLLSEPDSDINHIPVPNPFPILPDGNNLSRIDPEEPIRETGIYRDLWERKPLGDNSWDRRLHCCAWNDLDYTSREDYQRSQDRSTARRAEIYERHGAELQARIEESERAEAAACEGEEDEVAKTLKRE
ncbi:hypothetical protein VMCG_05227 [Cytospora schulzeri]|uniref:Uncharacterized protein n=1 Tax=Cytospora schulzeri TaxID=448051 RepID=A0A423WQL2_9PEZI|nr:hypothetical protein VMCG_05227 [Valsa malicola]